MPAAGQRIRFGMALDGQRGWHVANSLGESVVGPLGLLSILEMQLGLIRADISQSERVVQLRACLQAARTGSRFYERSFDADDIGTSLTLLRWRDQWYESGWNGKVPADASARIRDMGEVEAIARYKVAPGMGQRLVEVEVALDGRRPQIDEITLHTTLEELPLMWRRVMAKLPTASAGTIAPQAKAGSFLRKLQEALVAVQGGGKPAKLDWIDDGSLRIACAETRLASAEWFAAQLAKSGDDVLAVVEQEGGIFDAAVSARDLAREGTASSTSFRPTLQLLPLVLRLLWEPLDFSVLLKCLTLPVGPLPPYARRRIAERVAEVPGIGGTGWEDLIAKIEEHYVERKQSVRDDIAYWIENPRFPAEEGAPVAAILERSTRLAEFFQDKLQDEDEVRLAGWRAGQSQASAVCRALEILKEQGQATIGPEALDRLVAQATAAGSSNPLLQAEAGSQAVVSDPGAVLEPFTSVFWWQMAKIPLPGTYPWSPREIEQLQAAGVELPDVDRLLARQAQGWLAPAILAKERLTLMLPRADTEHHPAWLLIASLLKDPTICVIESVLNTAPTKGETSPVPFRSRPMACRWWHLPEGSRITWPDHASFSSLEQLLFNPYQWVLGYPAKIRPSALLSLPDDFLLLGKLAHRAVERLYGESGALTWSENKVLGWIDANLINIVREEGAVLLMPGRRGDLESFRLQFRDSIAHLHSKVLEAKAKSVHTEQYLEGDTVMGRVVGSADLLLDLDGAAQAIIDLKWAGLKKYREKLGAQAHIQLAIYAKLVELSSKRWPSVAYYILKDAELLTHDTDVFKGSAQATGTGSGTAPVWEQILATWRWRQEQINAGAIEIVHEELEPDERVALPPNGLPIEPLNPRYNPYVFLAGWGEGQ